MKKVTKIEKYSNEDFSGYWIFYYVKAVDKKSVIQALQNAGYRTEEKRIYSAYDCTGQHFCSRIRLSDISWSKARKCYLVKHRWNIDI